MSTVYKAMNFFTEKDLFKEKKEKKDGTKNLKKNFLIALSCGS